jgi:hypothetical protein
MSNELKRAKRSLDAVPSSEKKTQALQLLDEVDGGEKGIIDCLSKMEAELAKLAPTPREKIFFQLLPWIAEVIAVIALFTGVDAILTAEYCSRG